MTSSLGASSSKTADDLVKGQDLEEDKTRITAYITSTGESQETTVNYNKWARSYDKDLEGTYRAHLIAADALDEALPKGDKDGGDGGPRGRLRILDVGAGTGKVGIELGRRGFRHLDALEPAAAMLEVLKTTGVYNRTFNEYVGVGKNSVPSGFYDVVVVAGAMVKGHIPIEGVDDLIRMTKPGGMVCISMRKEFTEEGGDYQHLETRLHDLQQQRIWTKVSRKVVPNYFYNHDGVVYIYKVL
ncbi:methyltransferase-like protein 27 [Oratosquilla oratoria]|uniref:methyltransferase-like protein 27 n=1 Tax=Oratosquilla oratoria TaxID=337810 RepID=UPI003F75A4AE